MNTASRIVTFKGNPLHLLGAELKVGDQLPAFKLTAQDMNDITNENYSGNVLILSVVPSLDTPVCALQTKRFNTEATSLSSEVNILTVSLDLPFAQKRWCGAEGVDRVATGSDYKYRGFGEAFGVYIQELGLLSRSVFVADRQGRLAYVEYVPEVTEEPNYVGAIAAAGKLV